MKPAEHIRIEARHAAVHLKDAMTDARIAAMTLDEAETFARELLAACADLRSDPSIALVVAGPHGSGGHLFRFVDGKQVSVNPGLSCKCPKCGSFDSSPTRTPNEQICKSCLSTWQGNP